jgi:hypothetical protein
MEAEVNLDNIVNKFGNIAASPVIFGPVTWEYLHLWSLRYFIAPTLEQQKDASHFIQNVFLKLGCSQCVTHAFQYAEQFPVSLSSRVLLVQWFIDFHNTVNKRVGKAKFTQEDFYNKYLAQPGQKLKIDIPALNSAANNSNDKNGCCSNIYNDYIKDGYLDQLYQKHPRSIILLFLLCLFLCLFIVIRWYVLDKSKKRTLSL